MYIDHDIQTPYSPSTPGDGATVTRHLPSLPQAMRAIASGNWTVAERRLPPHYAGERPHAHAQVDILFYVLEGEPTFQVGEQMVKAAPGQWVIVNRGAVHTFFNAQMEPVRFLSFCLADSIGAALCEPGDLGPIPAVR